MLCQILVNSVLAIVKLDSFFTPLKIYKNISFVPWIKAVSDFTAFIHGTYKMCCLIEISCWYFNLNSNLLIVCKCFGAFFLKTMNKYFKCHINLEFQTRKFSNLLTNSFAIFRNTAKLITLSQLPYFNMYNAFYQAIIFYFTCIFDAK